MAQPEADRARHAEHSATFSAKRWTDSLIQRDPQRAPWRSWPGLRSQGARGGVKTGLAGRAPIVTTTAFRRL